MSVSSISFKEFIKNPIDYYQELDIDTLDKYLIKCAQEYYNNEGLISDEIYDDLLDYLKTKKPDSELFDLNNYDDSILFETVELPYPMMSLDKIKGTNIKTFNNWIKKFNHNYILSDKEDGISCLIHKKNNKIRVYTKNIGGHKGLDITELTRYININLKNMKNNYCIRGELIISKENFDKIKDDFKNARNAVSGLIHRKDINKSVLKLIDFVAYNVVYPRLKQSEQLKELEEMKLNVVPYIHVEEINQDFMINYFKKRKEESKYEIDGIVITSDTKKYDLPSDKNPDYAIAFKNLYEGLIRVSEVVNVIWNISRFGYIKPKIEIKPVEIEGSTITFCTAHNAKYIVDNNINVGSIVKIAKSGGVIPYIVEVIEQSKTPGLPTDILYKWNDTNVDIIVQKETAETKRIKTIKNLTNTMTVLKVKYFNEGYITRLVDEFNIKSLSDIINLNIEDIQDVIGENQGIKIYNNLISALSTCDYNILLLSSNCFDKGIGIKRIKIITNEIKDLFTKQWNKKELINRIVEIKTFDLIIAKVFVNGFIKFIKWFNNLNEKQNVITITLKKPTKKRKEVENNSGIFSNQSILLTGFRDETIQDFIIDNGGKIPSTFTKNISLLIVPNKTMTNLKTKKAKELNIKIITKDDFKKLYKINE